MSQPGPAAMGRINGNIGAMKLLMPLWFFRRAGAYQKKIPAATRAGERYCPLRKAIPLWLPVRYTTNEFHL
jgi:hypothetical protein